MSHCQQPILWVHGYALNPEHPLFTTHPQAPAIFCFDDAWLTREQISLQRIAFIYECLLDLPVEIRRGDVVEQVLAFAGEHQADGILTTTAVSPGLQQIRQQLAAVLPVWTLDPEPFLHYDGPLDLKRFSRYWKTAQDYAWGRGEHKTDQA